MSFINSFASNEKLGVQLSGPSGDYFETIDGNIGVQDPCKVFLFRVVTFTAPTGYTVKQFDWYVNDVFLRTTNSSTDHTSIAISFENTKVVCKVIYQNAGGATSTGATPVFQINGKPLNLNLNGPDNVDILTQTPSYSITAASGNQFLYTPAPGTFSTTWQQPSGWTAGTPTNNGNNITFTTDNYTGGAITATTVLTACGFPHTATKTVTRTHPGPTFPSSDAGRICGSSLGELVTAVYSINPVAGATSYTYGLHINPSGVPDNISFDNNGQTSLTTSSTSVTLYCTSTADQFIYLDVVAHFPDGGTSGNSLGINYSTLWWTPTFTWYGCFTDPGSSINVAVSPEVPGATYYWYLDGFLMDEGFNRSTTGWFWNGEHTISVKISTECGESNLNSETIPTNGCYNTFAPNSAASSLTVYPNPASSQVAVSLKELNKNEKTPGTALKDIREIKIVDKLGNVKKINRYAPGSKKVQVDLGVLNNDLYILQVSDGINRASISVNKLY